MKDIEKTIANQGKLTCNKNILFSIVNLATKEISGVVGLSSKTGNIFTRLIQNKNFNGIKIKYNTNGLLVIDVYIDVYSNTKAPDICFKIQENIKNNIISMVDVKTAKVNVHIVDVIIKKDEDDENAC